MKKKIILITFLFLSNLLFAQCTFTIFPYSEVDTAIKPSVLYPNFLKIHFTNKDTGWIFGPFGIVNLYQTINGGKNWNVFKKSNSNYYSPIITNNNFYLINTYNSIEYSNDLGKNWITYKLPDKPNFNTTTWNKLLFANIDNNGKDTLTAVGGTNYGDAKVIYKTYNSGMTWEQKFLDVDSSKIINRFYYIKYINKKLGFAYTVNQEMYKTIDAGETWQQCIIPYMLDVYLTDIAFSDSLHGWATSFNRGLFKTEDGGDNWKIVMQTEFVPENFYKITFTDFQHGWIGSSKGLYHTFNGGKNWDFIFVDSQFIAKDIFFTDSKHAFIVGNNLYKLDITDAVPDCKVLMLTDSTLLLPFTSAVFEWQQASDCVEGYRISIGTSPFGTQLYNHLDVGNTTLWTPPAPLPDNTQVYVTLYPYSSLGTATACQTFSYTTTQKVGIDELEVEGLKVRVVPNPFSNNFSLLVTAPQAELAEIFIYDALGRLISKQEEALNKGTNQVHFAAASIWVTGTYQYIIRTNSATTSGKLLKF